MSTIKLIAQARIERCPRPNVREVIPTGAAFDADEAEANEYLAAGAARRHENDDKVLADDKRPSLSHETAPGLGASDEEEPEAEPPKKETVKPVKAPAKADGKTASKSSDDLV